MSDSKPKFSFDIDIQPKAVPVDENLKLKQQSSQVSTLQASAIIFNSPNVQRDKDLNRMFAELQRIDQQAFEDNNGKGDVKNLYVNIIARMQDIKDHKMIPAEAVRLMFQGMTTIDMDSTLTKDKKKSKEQIKIDANAKLTENSEDSIEAMLAGMQAQVVDNNAAPVDAIVKPKPAQPDPKPSAGKSAIESFKL